MFVKVDQKNLDLFDLPNWMDAPVIGSKIEGGHQKQVENSPMIIWGDAMVYFNELPFDSDLFTNYQYLDSLYDIVFDPEKSKEVLECDLNLYFMDPGVTVLREFSMITAKEISFLLILLFNRPFRAKFVNCNSVFEDLQAHSRAKCAGFLDDDWVNLRSSYVDHYHLSKDYQTLHMTRFQLDLLCRKILAQDRSGYSSLVIPIGCGCYLAIAWIFNKYVSAGTLMPRKIEGKTSCHSIRLGEAMLRNVPVGESVLCCNDDYLRIGNSSTLRAFNSKPFFDLHGP